MGLGLETGGGAGELRAGAGADLVGVPITNGYDAHHPNAIYANDEDLKKYTILIAIALSLENASRKTAKIDTYNKVNRFAVERNSIGDGWLRDKEGKASEKDTSRFY